MSNYKVSLRVPVRLECPFCKEKTKYIQKLVFTHKTSVEMTMDLKRKLAEANLNQFIKDISQLHCYQLTKSECPQCYSKYPWKRLVEEKSRLVTTSFVSILLFITGFFINYLLRATFSKWFGNANVFTNYLFLPCIILISSTILLLFKYSQFKANKIKVIPMIKLIEIDENKTQMQIEIVEEKESSKAKK